MTSRNLTAHSPLEGVHVRLYHEGDLLVDVLRTCLTGRTLKTAFASVHELSVHVHGRFLGTVHVHVPFVPENSCCTVVVHG
jgi:hypothetical protein